MGEVIAMGGGGSGVGVAVEATVRAGVVLADIFCQDTSAELSLAFVFK